MCNRKIMTVFTPILNLNLLWTFKYFYWTMNYIRYFPEIWFSYGLLLYCTHCGARASIGWTNNKLCFSSDLTFFLSGRPTASHLANSILITHTTVGLYSTSCDVTYCPGPSSIVKDRPILSCVVMRYHVLSFVIRRCHVLSCATMWECVTVPYHGGGRRK
jgi:hypothetical protein